VRLKVFICLAMALTTFGLYWPARHFEFIYFDDPLFLMSSDVSRGLSLYGIVWALTSVVAENWHPVTAFSFLLTHQFFGFNPGAEHMLDAAIHAANAVLLFLVLLEMTGATWRSAIVAAIFAWHPLRVESVAWIAERKDVLFMFFMLLSLLCYVRYTRAGTGKPRPPPDQRTVFDIPPRTLFYNLALFFFVLSLLSKAMSVTLPFLMLLLDFWPLKRFDYTITQRQSSEGAAAKESEPPHVGSYAPVFTEKIRFFAASALFCIITYHVQKTHNAVTSLHQIGMGVRIENAISSYVGYLGKFFWPSNLAVIYPFPMSFDTVQGVLSGLLLIAISALCILQLSRRPYLAVGWFWYLGTMIPVIGLVQLAEQGMADRYTYLPLIGPVVSLVWLVGDWAGTNARWKIPALSAAVVILAVLPVLTEKQLTFWRDSATLFERTVSVTGENGAAEYSLALGLEHSGLLRQAAVHYRIAASIPPDTDHYYANYSFAEVLEKLGQYREAEARMDTALKMTPESAPDSAIALNHFALLLSTCPDAKLRDGPRAVQLAERACELTHDGSARYLTTLADAYAEAGRFDDAIATIQKAGGLAQQTGQTRLFNEDAQMLQLFMNHQIYTNKANQF
jgi:hypothetical protein